MSANLDLLAAKLYRAVLARQLFIGQRADVQADTVDPIDHQLILNLQDLDAQYLAAGGSVQGSANIVTKASRDADDQLDR